MKESTSDAGGLYFLAKARKLLGDAPGMLATKYNDAAGRAAYLAGFHAAQALISERTGRGAKKTRGGVNTEFHRLVRTDPRVDEMVRGFVGCACSLKAIADYETGTCVEVSPEVARDTTGTARRFVARMAELVGESGDTAGGTAALWCRDCTLADKDPGLSV